MDSETKLPSELTAIEAKGSGQRFGSLVVAALKSSELYEECSRVLEAISSSSICDVFLKEVLVTMRGGLVRGPKGMNNRLKMAHNLRRASDDLEGAALQLAIDNHGGPPVSAMEVSQLDSMVAHAANGHAAANALMEGINESVSEVLKSAIHQRAVDALHSNMANSLPDCADPNCVIHNKVKTEDSGLPN